MRALKERLDIYQGQTPRAALRLRLCADRKRNGEKRLNLSAQRGDELVSCLITLCWIQFNSVHCILRETQWFPWATRNIKCHPHFSVSEDRQSTCGVTTRSLWRRDGREFFCFIFPPGRHRAEQTNASTPVCLYDRLNQRLTGSQTFHIKIKESPSKRMKRLQNRYVYSQRFAKKEKTGLSGQVARFELVFFNSQFPYVQNSITWLK